MACLRFFVFLCVCVEAWKMVSKKSRALLSDCVRLGDAERGAHGARPAVAVRKKRAERCCRGCRCSLMMLLAFHCCCCCSGGGGAGGSGRRQSPAAQTRLRHSALEQRGRRTELPACWPLALLPQLILFLSGAPQMTRSCGSAVSQLRHAAAAGTKLGLLQRAVRAAAAAAAAHARAPPSSGDRDDWPRPALALLCRGQMRSTRCI